MKETGVLIDLDNGPIFWHTPAGRSSVSLPDSRDLWQVIWENRSKRLGFAHSHPGSGVPGPSHEDLTTFRAVERALGKGVVWWIASSDALIRVIWKDPRTLSYTSLVEVNGNLDRIPEDDPWWEMIGAWFKKLRSLSQEEKNNDGNQ